MLAVFTFNIAGYNLLYNYMAKQSDTALEQALDRQDYNESQLISIKQPTNLPYYTNSKDFQRIDGEVEIEGIKYKYVKCRIYNDSLEMLCIPNKAKMQIEQRKADYAKVAHDFQQTDTQKKSGEQHKSFQKSLSEYEEVHTQLFNRNSIELSTLYVLVNSVFEKTNFHSTAEQPPEVVTA